MSYDPPELGVNCPPPDPPSRTTMPRHDQNIGSERLNRRKIVCQQFVYLKTFAERATW